MTCVANPDSKPMASEAIVKPMANRTLTTPDIRMNPSGLISGEDVRKAIIGPQGSVVVSIPIKTAVVPQAQKGVNAPVRTLANMDTFDLFIRSLLSLSVLTYVFIAAAVMIVMARTSQLCRREVRTVMIVSDSKLTTYRNTVFIFWFLDMYIVYRKYTI